MERALNSSACFNKYCCSTPTRFELQDQNKAVVNFKARLSFLVQLVCLFASVSFSFGSTSICLFKFQFEECFHFEKNITKKLQAPSQQLCSFSYYVQSQTIGSEVTDQAFLAFPFSLQFTDQPNWPCAYANCTLYTVSSPDRHCKPLYTNIMVRYFIKTFPV